MTRPMIRPDELWSRHESFIRSLYADALLRLRDDPDLPELEDDINRLLFKHLRRAMHAQKRPFFSVPMYEANNQPSGADEKRAIRESKRPDFQWSFFDHSETDERKCFRTFVVECKRLGIPSSPSWVFNQNYIEHGVMRFVLKDWAYADGSSSSAMVGYVQSSTLSVILGEVNAAARAKPVGEIQLEGTFADGGLSRLRHVLLRASPATALKLEHFWIDLRRNAPGGAPTAPTSSVQPAATTPAAPPECEAPRKVNGKGRPAATTRRVGQRRVR